MSELVSGCVCQTFYQRVLDMCTCPPDAKMNTTLNMKTISNFENKEESDKSRVKIKNDKSQE